MMSFDEVMKERKTSPGQARFSTYTSTASICEKLRFLALKYGDLQFDSLDIFIQPFCETGNHPSSSSTSSQTGGKLGAAERTVQFGAKGSTQSPCPKTPDTTLHMDKPSCQQAF